MDIQKLLGAKLNRRRLLGNLGMMGAGAVITACGGAMGQEDDMNADEMDIAVLNFALNLEYLEAEFYLAAVGRTPTYETSGEGTEGTVTGGSAVDFGDDAALEAYANEIATDEENHVKFLRTALGDAAVARPNINIAGGASGAFGAAAAAAGTNAGLDDATVGALSAFDPYANPLFFLHGAFIFEDVGVTAYNGGATLISNKGRLGAAASILAVEAYHASEVRTLLYQERDTIAIPGGDGVTELPVSAVIGAISGLRAAVGGGKDESIVVDGNANIVPTDENGLAFARTTAEVLAIVYLGAAGTPGGFFPDGLNGSIK